MARKIDLTKPLSGQDRDYLARRGRYWEVEQNDTTFGESEGESEGDEKVTIEQNDTTFGESEGESEGDEKVTIEQVMDLKVEDLRHELESRNLDSEGLKDDLRDRLIDHLRAKGQLQED